MTVWIAQCKCPQGHAILASADEAETALQAWETIVAPLRNRITELIRKRILNPWCGICRATNDSWRYEVATTRWLTMAEALPALKQNEAEQRAAAAVIGDGDPGPGSELP